MTSNKGPNSRGGQRGLSGGRGVPWLAVASRFAEHGQRGSSTRPRARFSPVFDLMESRTLLTLPATSPATLLSAAVAVSPSLVTSGPETSNTDETVSPPVEVTGSFLTDGAEVAPGAAKALTFDKVVQGFADTCAFDSTLSAVARSTFNLASEISVLSVKSPTDIVYNVDLYEPTAGGGSQLVEVPVEFNGTFQPGDARSTDPNEFWPTLFQRAYLSLENSLGLDYHSVANAFLALTGLSGTSQAMATVTPDTISGLLDNGNPAIAVTMQSADPYNLDPADGVIGDHCYTVVGIESSAAGTYVTLRNPWGRDSTSPYEFTIDGVDDGIIRMPWATFTQYYKEVDSIPISGPSINTPQGQEPPPTFRNPTSTSITLYAEQSISLDLSATDAHGLQINYSLDGDGSASFNQFDGAFDFFAGPDSLGSHTFTVIASSRLSAASETFTVNVLPNVPSVGGVAASPSSFSAAGTDKLTLQATNPTIPAGTIDHVEFYLSEVGQGAGAATYRDIGYAAAASNWTWSGYVGGLQPGTYTVSTAAYGLYDGVGYQGAVTTSTTTLTVTAAPDYQPKITAMASQIQASPDQVAAGISAIGYGTTVDAQGNVRVFWADSQTAVYFREFNASGQALGSPVQVAGGLRVSFVGLPDGSFDEIYTPPIPPGGTPQFTIMVQRFDASGAPVGGPIVAATNNSDPEPVAAVDGSGNLLIAYVESSSAGSTIDAVTLSASGSITRAPWRLNSQAYGNLYGPAVALDASGDGVITWNDEGQKAVMALRVTQAGLSNDSAELTVFPDPGHSDPAQAAGVDAQGDITIAYSDQQTIHIHRYGADGSDGGDQIAYVAGTTTIYHVRLATNPEGWTFVAWDETQTGVGLYDVDEVNGKLINPQGRVQSTSILVPTATAEQQSMYSTGVGFNDAGEISVAFTQLDPNDPNLALMSTYARIYRADMAPQFAGPYRFTVPLASPVGTVVGKVQATDPDGDAVRYSLQGSGAFAIDPTTGVVTVADATALKSTTVAAYDLSVQADDGNPTANIKPTDDVAITVVDPTPPRINSIPTWTIDAGESVVPVITATDPTGAALTFSAAVGGGASATARVDGNNLVVTPAAGYTGTFPVTVTATNGLVSSTTTFQVAVVTPSLAPVADLRIHGPASVKLAGTDSSGTALTYSAAIAGSGAGSAPAMLSIENNVLSITPSPGYVGTFTVTASVSDGPDTASQSFRVTVVKAQTPTISWTNPADIVAGTPLTGFQLDATASVPGTFAYTPAAGTILSAGANQVLAVTFTPADTTEYTTATAIVHINVDQPILPPQHRPNPPPPDITGIVNESRTKKGLTAITIGFDEALDPGSVGNPALYSALGAAKKHGKVVYSKVVRIKGITFDGNARVTIQFAKPYKGAVRATVVGRILAADGASSDINYSAVVD